MQELLSSLLLMLKWTTCWKLCAATGDHLRTFMPFIAGCHLTEWWERVTCGEAWFNWIARQATSAFQLLSCLIRESLYSLSVFPFPSQLIHLDKGFGQQEMASKFVKPIWYLLCASALLCHSKVSKLSLFLFINFDENNHHHSIASTEYKLITGCAQRRVQLHFRPWDQGMAY